MKSLQIFFIIVLLCSAAYAGDKLNEVVIFGDSLGVTQKEAATNIEVLDSKKISELSASSTVDLLKMISGVTVNSYDAKHVNIDMGGYGAEKGGLNTVVLLNGRRMSNPDMSSVDWSFIPVDNIDRIEVYHGGNSVLFGSRATGGVINIVTKKPVKTGFSVKTEAGSYGTYHGNISGQYASDKLSVMLNVDKYKTDGYRENSDLKTQSVSGDVTYYNEKFEINGYMNYTGSDYGLPGGVTREEMAEHGRDYSKTPDDGGKDYEYFTGAGVKAYLPVGELNLKADFHKRHRDYNYYTSSYHAVDELKSRAFNPFYTLKIDHKDYSNRLTAGIDYIKYDVESRTESAYGDSSFEIDRATTGYYVSDRAKYKGVVVQAGFRTENLDDDYKSDGNTKTESENAYNLLLGYETAKAGSFYVRYDRSFRFPSTDELREYYGTLNTELDPQVAKTVEAGYKYGLKGFYGGASVYKQKTDKEIFTNPTYVPYSNLNLDTKRKGGKLKLGFRNKTFTAEGVYTYVDAEINEGDYQGKEIPLLSKNQFKATLGYRTPVGVGVYYFANYYSSTYGGNDYANTQEKIDSYWVSDVKVDYQYKKFGVFFKVNNVFNEKYYDYAYRTAYTEAYYPAPERNFMAGLTYRY